MVLRCRFASARPRILPPASAEVLLQGLLGDDAGMAPLKSRLIAHTQDNPFFLEESVRTLVEAQVLVGERGAYRLARALPTIQVPAARIDRSQGQQHSWRAFVKEPDG